MTPLQCRHMMINVSDIEEAKAFFLSTLGFPALESHPSMFAFRAGDVRFSIFGGGSKKEADAENDANVSVLFSTPDIAASVTDLRSKGVRFEGEVQEAPGFMKFIVMLDPDNNRHYLGQYLADPLASA